MLGLGESLWMDMDWTSVVSAISFVTGVIMNVDGSLLAVIICKSVVVTIRIVVATSVIVMKTAEVGHSPENLVLFKKGDGVIDGTEELPVLSTILLVFGGRLDVSEGNRSVLFFVVTGMATIELVEGAIVPKDCIFGVLAQGVVELNPIVRGIDTKVTETMVVVILPAKIVGIDDDVETLELEIGAGPKSEDVMAVKAVFVILPRDVKPTLLL